MLLSLLFVAALARADTPPQFDSQRLSQHVKVLSSNEFEGRGPNTPGETKTVAYLIEQFKAAGLTPGGDLVSGARSWTQDVALGRFEIKGTATLTAKYGNETQALVQGEKIVVRAAMTGARRVDFDSEPLVFVGYGINAPERHWDDFKGVDLKGKLAIVLINEPYLEAGAGNFGIKPMSYYGHWSYKFEELARRGALGAIIIHEIAPDSYDWRTLTYLNTGVMYDIVRKQAAKAHAPLEAWIQRDAVVDLFNRAGLNFEAAKKLAQSHDFKPIVLSGLTLSAHYAVGAQVIHSKNVVARIGGRKRPNETVLYSAHWDHFGIGAPDAKGDTIYHGAVDNGTGVAALLELARAYAKQPAAKRSVVFLAVTAEEKGLLGSEYYVTNPLFPLADTAGMINLDGLSPLGPARDFTIFSSVKLDLIDQLITKGRQRNLAYVPDPKPETGFSFRSDHFSFAKRGVPAIWFGSGHDLEGGGIAAGDAAQKAYWTNSYHRPSDEWSAQWQFTGMAHDLEFLYEVGRDLADSSSWPNWLPDSEFHAVRERSANKRK
jgi:Zn-dependent M28 family amino/carboxypeptidase